MSFSFETGLELAAERMYTIQKKIFGYNIAVGDIESGKIIQQLYHLLE